MWTASLTGKVFTGGSLTVTVAFTNGKDSFNQDFDLSGGSLNTLAQRVSGRIDQLNISDTLMQSIDIGPVPAYVPPTRDELAYARSQLAQVKQDVDLGIIKETDAIYIDALAAAKAAL